MTVTIDVIFNGVAVPLVIDDDALSVITNAITPTAPAPEWMSTHTAAAYLDIPVGRLRKLVERREIPFYRECDGCRVFFNRRDLDTWMQTFRHEAKRG